MPSISTKSLFGTIQTMKGLFIEEEFDEPEELLEHAEGLNFAKMAQKAAKNLDNV